MSAHGSEYPLLPSMAEVAGYAPARRIAWILLFLLAFLAIALGFTPWQQSVSGTGRVIAFTPLERQQTISAPVDGRVVRWHAAEGTRVKRGDVIGFVGNTGRSTAPHLHYEVWVRDQAQNPIHFILDEYRSFG